MDDNIIKRDQNFATVGAGVDPSDTSSIQMLSVDPATDYVLVVVTGGVATDANEVNIARRDQNHRTVAMGWNEDTQLPQELLMDDDGRILCDLLITP